MWSQFGSIDPALDAGSGRIVNVSTLAAGGLDLSDTQCERRRFRGIGAYRASKQAGRVLSWSLAKQLVDQGIRVCRSKGPRKEIY